MMHRPDESLIFEKSAILKIAFIINSLKQQQQNKNLTYQVLDDS